MQGLEEAPELRSGEGLSWAEIAERVGLSGPDAARMPYVRARAQLNRWMG